MSKAGAVRRVAAPLMATVAAVLLLTPLGEGPLTALLPVGDVDAVDFATLKLTDKPNQYLLCPADFCGDQAHGTSPMFDLSVMDLRARWDTVIAAQPRLVILAEDDGQIDYVQRTAMVRFPDIITVRFISLIPDRSTLAIYSRSVYGTGDFGVNRARIEAWLFSINSPPRLYERIISYA